MNTLGKGTRGTRKTCQKMKVRVKPCTLTNTGRGSNVHTKPGEGKRHVAAYEKKGKFKSPLCGGLDHTTFRRQSLMYCFAAKFRNTGSMGQVVSR